MTSLEDTAAAAPSPWAVYLAIYASVVPVGVAIGGLVPLMALILDHRGIDPALIGVNAAMPAVGVICAAPFVPRFAWRLGVLGAMALGTVLCALLVLGLAAFDSLTAWLVLRFAFGMALTLPWVIGETWLNGVVRASHRGRVMAIYVTVFSGAIAVGPLAVGLFGHEGWAPFAAIAALMAASLLPLLPVAGRTPRPAGGHRPASWRLLGLAPTAFLAAGVFGLMDNSTFALLPIYGLRHGFAEAPAVALLSVFLAGALLLQVPVGWLADRFGRRGVLCLCAATGVAGPLLAETAIAAPLVLWPVVLLWGGGVAGLYTVALTMIGDRFPAGELAGANAAFVMVFQLGSIAGPPLSGAAMSALGPVGLPLVIAASAAGFLAVALARAARRKGSALSLRD